MVQLYGMDAFTFHPLHLSFYFASFKKFVKEDGRMEMRIGKQGERHKLERRKKKKVGEEE